jgi:hypothetical protein
MAQDTPQFQVGINYPWIDYAWDFGDPPPSWVAPANASDWREKKRNQIVADFHAFRRLGLFAVRWFILADGLSYGVGERAPELMDGQWRFDPLPAEDSFHHQLRDDFEFVLKTCREAGIKFVPSLLDFHWCHPGTVVDAAGGVVKGGRGDIMLDKAKRIRFLDQVLEPLLDVSAEYADVIYAWELINEPEWVSYIPSFFNFGRGPNKTIPQGEMQEFILAGVERINRRAGPNGEPAFRSTVGFAHWDAIESWDSIGLGVTLHQYHYYAPDKRKLPGRSYPNLRNCFIGEFATKFQRGWPDLKGQDQTQTISSRLRCVAEKGYHSAFLWSARAVDEATAWGDADQGETLAYLNPADENLA